MQVCKHFLLSSSHQRQCKQQRWNFVKLDHQLLLLCLEERITRVQLESQVFVQEIHDYPGFKDNIVLAKCAIVDRCFQDWNESIVQVVVPLGSCLEVDLTILVRC